jgi:Fic/DOC family
MEPREKLIGQAGLIETLGLTAPTPATVSICGRGARRTFVENGRTTEKYGAAYAPENTVPGLLKFALRYEPLEMGILAETFVAVDADELAAWIRSEPNGVYARRAWFLYEWFTGRTLDVENAGTVKYIPALDPSKNVVAKGVASSRHKVTDNLLGVPDFCPTVRRTDALSVFMAAGIDRQARELVASCTPVILTRAVNYLYTKETKSSFEIEHEVTGGKKAERFVAALKSAASFDPTSIAGLIDLHNVIVDPRYAADGLRDFQNFVGDSSGGYREVVHYICPRPEDLGSLMSDWISMTTRLKGGAVDAVTMAALISFAFVFLHPFEDGNGRIHRFLIHHILSTEGFTPPDILFPVSAAIVRDRRGYDLALESVSKVVQPFIDWRWTATKEIEVSNHTAQLYRYFDATAIVEFLYAKVEETVQKDLKEELDYVARFQAALSAVMDVIDMPDRRAALFVNLCMQNNGSLSKSKRELFPELSDQDIEMLQAATRKALGIPQ